MTEQELQAIVLKGSGARIKEIVDKVNGYQESYKVLWQDKGYGRLQHSDLSLQAICQRVPAHGQAVPIPIIKKLLYDEMISSIQQVRKESLTARSVKGIEKLFDAHMATIKNMTTYSDIENYICQFYGMTVDNWINQVSASI